MREKSLAFENKKKNVEKYTDIDKIKMTHFN